jgi:hypothetical protein
MLHFTIRQYNNQTDEAFIYNSTLISMRNSAAYRHLANDVFYGFWNIRLAEVIANSTILVAVDPDDTQVIYGFLIVGNTPPSTPFNIIHFAYTKAALRKNGICKALMKAASLPPIPIVYTISTIAGDGMAKNMQPSPIHNPFLIVNK